MNCDLVVTAKAQTEYVNPPLGWDEQFRRHPYPTDIFKDLSLSRTVILVNRYSTK